MAQASNTMFFKLAIVLTLVLMISLTESRNLDTKSKNDDTLVCNSVHGQVSGETCTSVAQDFGLSLDGFLEINPNINCDAVFVGEWLCVEASN
ncbi:hypothetical protein ACS0TY_028831 [Phlomoides rotata]